MDTYRLCVDFLTPEALLDFVESVNVSRLLGDKQVGAMQMDALHGKVFGKAPHSFILRDLREDGRFLAIREVCTTETVLATRNMINVEWETDGEDVELPKLFEVPSDIQDGDIADWLSDKHGWLVRNWTRAVIDG